MKRSTFFSSAAILALAWVTMGAQFGMQQEKGAPVAAGSSILKAGSDLAQKLFRFVAGSPVQAEASDKACGNITCPANSDCCTGCDGNPVCIPKRSKIRDCLIECPAP